MSQHIIRDSNGQIEKILDDKEYAKHQKIGCFKKTIFYLCLSLLVVYGKFTNDNKGKTRQKESSSQVLESISSPSTENEMEEAPQIEEKNADNPSDMKRTSIVQEEGETMAEYETESDVSDNSSPPHKLSRKERRALRRQSR